MDVSLFFPEEAHGLQLIYNTLEVDLQQVELDGQRITQHLLTALAASYEDISPSGRFLVVRLHEDCGSTHLYLVPAADGGMTDQAGLAPVPMDARPFRLIIQTIHITATLGGFLDRRTLRQAADTVVEVALSTITVRVATQPPHVDNHSNWYQFNSAKTPTQARSWRNVARMVAPAHKV